MLELQTRALPIHPLTARRLDGTTFEAMVTLAEIPRLERELSVGYCQAVFADSQ